MRYSELTRRYFESTPANGVLLTDGEAGVPDVFRGSAGQRERGTWVQFDIQVQGGRIQDARFLAFGCPHTIAVASWVAEQGYGREVALLGVSAETFGLAAHGAILRAALPESIHALRERFEVPQEKLGRLLIIEDAWLAALTAAIAKCRNGPIS